MLIKLTFFDKGRTEFYLPADRIQTIQRDELNPLMTNVVTSLMTPKGPVMFQVVEGPDTIATMVNNALRAGAGHGTLN